MLALAVFEAKSAPSTEKNSIVEINDIVNSCYHAVGFWWPSYAMYLKDCMKHCAEESGIPVQQVIDHFNGKAKSACDLKSTFHFCDVIPLEL